MSAIQLRRARSEAGSIGEALVFMPSLGVGETSKAIVQQLRHFTDPTPTFSGRRPVGAKDLDEQLYNALASFKVRTALVAMHLDREWRTGLFRQLDSLMAVEDWEATDPPPTLGSYSTFLRMLTFLRPQRRPGLGATDDGRLIAAWTTRDDDRLTIECLPNDFVRWHLSTTIEGERERAAGETPLLRIKQVLQPFDPERWFNDAHNLSTA